MKKWLVLSVLVFLSIFFLLPLTWYQDVVANQMTYQIDGFTGFQVFSPSYPVVFIYVVAFPLFFLNSKKAIFRSLLVIDLAFFILLLLIFPVFLGFLFMSRLILGRFTLTTLLIIGLTGCSVFCLSKSKE